MSTRLNQLSYSLDRATVSVYGNVTIGATGAVGAVDANGFTIARSGVGAYTITLTDLYPTSPANYVAAGTVTSPLLFVGCVPLNASTRVFQQMSIVSETVKTDGKINIIFDASANTPADPASGSVLRFKIDLKNSSTPRKGS